MNPLPFILTADEFVGDCLQSPAYRLDFSDQGGTSLATRGFLYSKVPTHRIDWCEELESLGFRLVDTLVTLQARKAKLASDAPSGVIVRWAMPTDADQIGLLAQGSFAHTRFHQDPHLSNEVANQIKENWARNYFTGQRGSHMTVAERAGEIVGFTLWLATEDSFVVDLYAVHEKFRRQGIGRAMIAHGAVSGPSKEWIRMGTQIANKASLNLVTQWGFSYESSHYVFHKHL